MYVFDRTYRAAFLDRMLHHRSPQLARIGFKINCARIKMKLAVYRVAGNERQRQHEGLAVEIFREALDVALVHAADHDAPARFAHEARGVREVFGRRAGEERDGEQTTLVLQVGGEVGRAPLGVDQLRFRHRGGHLHVARPDAGGRERVHEEFRRERIESARIDARQRVVGHQVFRRNFDGVAQIDEQGFAIGEGAEPDRLADAGEVGQSAGVFERLCVEVARGAKLGRQLRIAHEARGARVESVVKSERVARHQLGVFRLARRHPTVERFLRGGHPLALGRRAVQ